ncbi:DNA primase [Pelomonas sp. V22]|uniref:DNA primase n=1 Tax=Pelomonas sp. V22 TaxID=2822139 RepID=UPI0024A818AE|nr:DNA primase [Pelomonas sp. V22]MDI4632286.1 DNA primase [Pelomonas sp. V22]
MIPPGFIQDLLARTDIVDVVGRHVELKKGGANLMGLCPFHGEKSPSFSVSPSKQFYHCFGCGVNGNAISFLMEYSGLGFVEAVQELAQGAGMQVPSDERSPQERERAAEHKKHQATLSETLERAAGHYRTQLKSSPRAIDYLKGRGLSGQIAARFGLGYAPEGWRALASAFPSYDDPLLVESGLVIEKQAEDEVAGGPSAGPPQAGPHLIGGPTAVPGGRGAASKRYDRFRDRVMFPIRNVQGETIGFGGRVLDKGEPKYLNSPETPVFHKGRELYGLFEGRAAFRQRGYALVVEGYMDVVALAQHGFGNAVATLGTACTPDHVQKLFRFTDSVVFSFDGDAAGRRAAVRALEASLPHINEMRTVRFLFLPTEHDPDSYVRELGAEAFERCIEAAVPLSRQLVETSAEGCDLGSAEGRARMLSRAKPLWLALPDGLLKRQLLGELAKRAQLPDQELMSFWQVAAAPRPAPASVQEHVLAEGPPPEYFDAGDEHFHHPAPSQQVPRRKPQHPAAQRKPWRKDWKRDPDDDMPRLPRRAPPGPADVALRMLLLNSLWWEQLSADDQGLLHDLPEPHGPLVAWLERFLVNHGPGPWTVVEAALTDEGLIEQVQALGGWDHAEEAALDDFRAVLRTLLISRLEEEQRLITSAGAAADLGRYRELNEQIRLLKQLKPAA